MKYRERYKRIIMFFASLIILAVQTGLFSYIWFNFYNYEKIMGVLYWQRGHWAIISLYAVQLFFFAKIYGAFKVGYLRVLDVLLSQILSLLCVNAITYLQLALIGRWKFLSHIKPILGLTVVNVIVIILWVVFMRWVYAKLYPPHQLLLIHGDVSPETLIKKVSSRKDKYIISETIHVDHGEETIKKKIIEFDSILIGEIPSHLRNVILKYSYEHSIRCYSIPKISDIMIMSADQIHLFDTPLLLSRNKGLTLEQRFVKRALDLVLSCIGLLVAFPLFLIIAVLIKLYDKGNVFYKQDRLTINGKIFKIYKFRSMRANSEIKGERLAMKNDSRVTPVGRILRNLHLDELPQLFNIIKGDMSLVGPRPERPRIAEEYQNEIPEFNYRLKAKAGLTGYAQIYGKYNTVPYDKLKLDLSYIVNYSICLDLKLIMMTFKILFQKENTEGVEAWQTTAATKEKDSE